MKEKFRSSKWSQFEYEKTTFRALKRAIKVDLLLIFCCYYTDRVTKTQRIRTEGFSFADKFPVTKIMQTNLGTKSTACLPYPPKQSIVRTKKVDWPIWVRKARPYFL
jgi:hypothetical protein